MILGLAHVCFIAKDLDRALRFYTETLGGKHCFDFLNAQGVRHGVYIKVGPRAFIELFLNNGVTPAAEKQSFRHICLEVDDVAKTVTELRAKGVEITEPKMGKDQAWQAWLKDPEGNDIELHAYLPQSWQTPHLG